MGSLCPDRHYEKYDIRRLVKTPIWAAHSSDDTNVRIDSDDYCAAELEKLGADINTPARINTGTPCQANSTERKMGRLVFE